MDSTKTPGTLCLLPLKYRILICCILFCLSAAGLIFLLTLVVNDLNAPPAPSISLLSITAAGANFTDLNLTCVFSISSRNKAPITYSHFRVTGDQEGPKASVDFITASAASVQSLEQSGPSRDTITFDLPHSRVMIFSWYSVQNNNNESISTGFSVLRVKISFDAKYVHGRRRSAVDMSGECRGPDRHPLLAEIVVNSVKHSPELKFTTDVIKCDVTRGVWLGVVLMAFATSVLLMLFFASISLLKKQT